MMDYTTNNVISLTIPEEDEPFLCFDPIKNLYDYKLHNMILDGCCNHPKQNSSDYLDIMKAAYINGIPFDGDNDLEIINDICDKFNDAIANNIIKALKIKNDMDKPKVRKHLYENYICPNGMTMRVNDNRGDFSQYALATIVVNETDFLHIQTLFC